MSLENTHDIGNVKIVMLGGSGGATALSDLTDTNISNPASGQVLKYNGLKWANGDIVSGLGIGKKTSVSSNVIITDIDLHREPVAGDRLLIYFDATVQNPTGLTTYNNGTAVTKNLENASPLYYNAGWNVAEFKNDGLLYNNVWVRVQNVPVAINYSAGSGISISNNTIVNIRRGALTGAIDSISSGYAHVVMNGARDTFAAGALIVAQSEASGSATNLRIQYGSQASDSQDFRFYDTEGETLSLSISSGNTIIAMIDSTGYRAIVLKVLDIEAQVGEPVRELRKLKIDGVVYDTDGMRTYEASNVANNNITLSVLNAFQFVQKVIAINTGAHSGSSSAWNLVISDGMEVASVALKNADGTAFADDIHENELLFVYVDTAGNVARVLEIHSHDLEILKDAIITEKTVSGNPITITDALPYPAVSLSAEIEAEQDLHGYDKPWVGGAGKNKLPITVDSVKDLNGGASSWSNNSKVINGVTFKLNTDSDGNLVSISTSGTANGGNANLDILRSFTVSASFLSGTPSGSTGNNYYIRCGIGGEYYTDSGNGVAINGRIVSVWIGVANNNTAPSNPWLPMIESGSAKTSYEPYSNICPISGHTSVTITDYDSESNTATVTIQLDQTVYGGSLNLTTGELTVTHKGIDMGGLTWNYDAGTTRFYSGVISDIDAPSGDVVADVITEQFKATYASGQPAREDGTIAISVSGAAWVYNTSSGTDKTAFASLVDGHMMVYKLAAPTTIQLTPDQLTMLKGYNRLSSDGGGDITLTYKADRLAAIEAALAALA